MIPSSLISSQLAVNLLYPPSYCIGDDNPPFPPSKNHVLPVIILRPPSPPRVKS